jgi:cell division protein FtsI/penicillin-binding protein 2
MWKDYNKKTKKEKFVASNNRLRIAGTIIFLLFIVLIYKLFSLQIINHDLYLGLAQSQHQLYNILQPTRGEIYLKETFAGQENLFKVATNRDFAHIYVVPKDILDPDELAEKFWQFFDEERVVKEVENIIGASHRERLNNRLQSIAENEDLSEEEKEVEKAEIISQAQLEFLSNEAIELRELQINNQVEKRKQEIIDRYLLTLDKPNDPYEPFMNKVEDETLLSLYAFLLSDEDKTWQADELERKLERVYRKDDGGLINIPGLAFHINSHRFYPDPSLASHILGFVGIDGYDNIGRYGLEGFFELELTGVPGHIQTERGSGSTIIVNNREYLAPQAGSDLVLTIDRSVQHYVCEKLIERVEFYQAEGGSVVIVNPKSGEIIAMCSVPSFDPNNYRLVSDISIFNNPAISHQFEPGSTFKTITMAIALDQEKINPNTTYNDTGEIMISGWPKPIRNSDFFTHGAHGIVDMKTVLNQSLNTGTIFAMRQVGAKKFAQYLQDFGLGEKTGIELGNESSGNISNLLSNRIKEIDAATASYGQGIALTPLQMAMAYQVIANNGVLMKPYIVSEIINHDSSSYKTSPQKIRQVISQKSANTTMAMLVNVVEKGHAGTAKIPGYYIGGKTGTAQIPGPGGYLENQHIHVFTGIAPIDDPAFVMLVKIDKPKGVRFAVTSVVPLWRDIAEYLLNYYQIPKSH